MTLSQMARRLPTRLVAVAATFALAGTAAAQSGPRIPLDAHGYRAQQIRNDYYRHHTAQPRTTAPAVVASQPVYNYPTVTAAVPNVIASAPALTTQPATPSAQSFIAIRGTDGVLRYYPTVSAGTGVVVVNPGQPATARVR